MNLLRRCLHELYTLFVDDAATAALTVAWIAAACLVLRFWDIGSFAGPTLFIGLTVVFMVGLRSDLW